MSTSQSMALDTWNYIFFSLELVLNVCFALAYPVITYICIVQRTLHINFRILLQLANTGYLISDLQRSILVVQRLCCIGNENTPFALSLTYVLLFGAYLFTGSWFGLVMERVYATWKCDIYEKKCKSWFETILIGVLGITPAILISVLNLLKLGELFEYILMGSEFFIDISTAIALYYLLHYNKRSYNDRHSNNLALSERYQVNENIRATKYIIPVAIFDFFLRLILAGLIFYSVIFTDKPLGSDTSHISHAYDLNSAVRRLFFGLWLITKSDSIFPDQKKNTVHVINSEKYFQDLKKQWE